MREDEEEEGENKSRVREEVVHSHSCCREIMHSCGKSDD